MLRLLLSLADFENNKKRFLKEREADADVLLLFVPVSRCDNFLTCAAYLCHVSV